MVKVRFYGQFRKTAGADSRELQNAAGLSLRELLAGAGASSPNLVSNLLVNGRNCMFLQGLDTVIQDGDVVDVLPVVGGG